jgi:hypothetical protein
MKGSIPMDTIVASRSSHAPHHARSREDYNFGDNNTYNRDSYLDEADMNS